MKQKKLGNILYVFDVMPYEITQDTDAEIIKVQEESYNGFLDMNQSLAEKIVKYNYHTMCVNVPEWAPYVDQEDPQGQLTFGVYGENAALYIAKIERTNSDNEILESWEAGVDLTFPFQCNVNETDQCAIEFGDDVDPYSLDITGGEYIYIRWQDQETGHWWASTGQMMQSISVSINAAPQPSTTYTITLDAENLSDQNIEVKLNDNQVALTGEYVCQANDTLTFWPLANPSDYIASNMDGFDDAPGQEHWWKIVNSSETIVLTYLGTGVNFNASWVNGNSTPENVSQINIGNTSVTGNDLTDPDWAETVRLHPGASQVQYFVSTGLPTDMDKFEVVLYNGSGSDHHFAYKQTDPDTGEVWYSDARDASGGSVSNPGIWTYNNTPDSGLPWIAFTLPEVDENGNAWVDNAGIVIDALVSGS